MKGNLTIPENIPLRWELIHGLGKVELLQCLTVLIPALVIELALLQVLTSPTAPLMLLMVYILLTFSCYMFFGKMDTYQSVYQFLRRGIQFQQEQQKFHYKRRKEIFIANEEESE